MDREMLSQLTTTQAAQWMGTTPAAILRYVHSGILRHTRHGRYILVDSRAVLALIAVIRNAREGKPQTPRERAAAATAAPTEHSIAS